MSTTKPARLAFRLPAAEKRLYELAASRSSESVSEFVRRAARTEAQRLFEAEPAILLSTEEAAKLIAVLDADSPAEATDLADLARYRHVFER